MPKSTSFNGSNKNMLFTSQVNLRQSDNSIYISSKESKQSSVSKSQNSQKQSIANSSDFLLNDPLIEIENVPKGNGKITTYERNAGMGGLTITTNDGL